MNTSDTENSTQPEKRGIRLISLDWRVLTVELLVVFIGLFAALQLDNYRDQQRFEEAQQRYLSRMHGDLADYLEWTAGMMNMLEYNKRAVDHVYESLKAGEIINGDTGLFERGVIYFAHLPSLPLPRSSYEEMVASGMFTALESEDLQSAISQLYSWDESALSNFSWWRVGPMNFQRRLMGFVEYYDDPGEIAGNGIVQNEPIRRVSYDFEVLASDPSFRNGFYWARDSVSDWLSFLQSTRNEAEKVMQLIENQPARD